MLDIEADDVNVIVEWYLAQHPELKEHPVVFDVREIIDCHMESSEQVGAYWCQKLAGNNEMLQDFDPKERWG